MQKAPGALHELVQICWISWRCAWSGSAMPLGEAGGAGICEMSLFAWSLAVT